MAPFSLIDVTFVHFLHQLTPLHTNFFFFFNDTATTEIYTLSLHDALPISFQRQPERTAAGRVAHLHSSSRFGLQRVLQLSLDRKSTRLNSSHDQISYAVFCLKKKNAM